MTNVQLYFAIAVPTFAVLVGILVNMMQVNTINARFTSLENRFAAQFDMLLGKIIEIDNRLTRVEERLEHLH